jgi:hypothetical protein
VFDFAPLTTVVVNPILIPESDLHSDSYDYDSLDDSLPDLEDLIPGLRAGREKRKAEQDKNDGSMTISTSSHDVQEQSEGPSCSSSLSDNAIIPGKNTDLFVGGVC